MVLLENWIEVGENQLRCWDEGKCPRMRCWFQWEWLKLVRNDAGGELVRNGVGRKWWEMVENQLRCWDEGKCPRMRCEGQRGGAQGLHGDLTTPLLNSSLLLTTALWYSSFLLTTYHCSYILFFLLQLLSDVVQLSPYLPPYVLYFSSAQKNSTNSIFASVMLILPVLCCAVLRGHIKILHY